MNPDFAMKLTERHAMLLSALVMPGLGQFMQQRWLAGLFFSVAFLICFVALAMETLVPLFANIKASIDMAEGANVPLRELRIATILIWLALALLIYFGSLLDAWLAEQRLRRLREQQKVAELVAGNQNNFSLR